MQVIMLQVSAMLCVARVATPAARASSPAHMPRCSATIWLQQHLRAQGNLAAPFWSSCIEQRDLPYGELGMQGGASCR